MRKQRNESSTDLYQEREVAKVAKATEVQEKRECIEIRVKYTINPEPECLPEDKKASGVVKPSPAARVLPRPRLYYPPVNTRCEGFIMLIRYSFLYFKEETNAFHYQKVAIFLCRKSVERECRWEGEERNQALFQNLNSETCKQKFTTTLVTSQQYKSCCQEPGPPWLFSGFSRKIEGTS